MSNTNKSPSLSVLGYNDHQIALLEQVKRKPWGVFDFRGAVPYIAVQTQSGDAPGPADGANPVQ